jgi:hypothetical protein
MGTDISPEAPISQATVSVQPMPIIQHSAKHSAETGNVLSSQNKNAVTTPLVSFDKEKLTVSETALLSTCAKASHRTLFISKLKSLRSFTKGRPVAAPALIFPHR